MKNILKIIAFIIINLLLSISEINAQKIHITGGYFKVNNNSLVLQDMNLINDGTFTSTDGSVVFTGTSTASISGTNSLSFDSLSINKTSDEVQLEQDIMIASHLELTSGLLDLQTSDASMADPSTISGASSDNYVQTSSTGTLSRPVADADVTYPIGNSSYNPAILNNDAGTADFYAMRVRDELLEGGSSGAMVTEYGVNRTWEISENTAGGSNLDVTLTWDDTDEIGTTGSEYVQASYNASEWNTLASGAAGSTFGLNSLASADNSNLGDYAIFEDRSPLTDSYICNENGTLNVTGTINNTENYHAGTNLTSNALIEATASILYTASTEISMSTGFEVENGAYFHAFIANCTFSNIETIEQREEEVPEQVLQELLVEVFPNPFSSQTNIKFYLETDAKVQLFISDLNGRILHSKTADAQAGWQQTNFEAGNLPNGNYLLYMRSNEQQVVKQLVVQK